MKTARQVGDPIIRQILRKVSLSELTSKKFLDCVMRMREVNDEMNGVGISANQVGYDMRVSLMHLKATKFRPEQIDAGEKIMINPVIVKSSEATEYMWEGCLSVAEAGIFCKVKRSKRVTVEYMNLNGEKIVEKLDGMYAHIAQHEISHLDGGIFLDLEIDNKTFMSASEYIKMRKKAVS